mmetsp:Transcript_10932/g.24839  ORF Transcript_10932/g.24839 Transcript_10932/m.24839 type:complete len:201 (-) Transcript_10932:33-635(-)
MSIQGEMGCVVATHNAPNLDGTIQRTGCEDVSILRIPAAHHHIVCMALKDIAVRPILVPIPQLDGHVVRRCDDIRHARMYCYTSNIVCVRFKLVDLLKRVVVEHSNLHVIRSSDDPLLPRGKFCATYWKVTHLHLPQQCLGVVVPDEEVPRIERREYPGLLLVEVDGFHTITSCRQLLFDVQLQWHRLEVAGGSLPSLPT